MKRNSFLARLIATILTASLITAPVSATLGYQQTQAEDQELPLFQSEEFSPREPEVAEQKLRSLTTPLTYEQLLDYAMTQMLQNRFREAVILYEQALRHAPNDEQRIFAMMWLGQAILDSASNADEEARPAIFKRAGAVFNRASQLSPASSGAAVMRVIAWTNAGDQLELSAAEHDLRRLGVDLEGNEVFLATGCVATIAIAASKITASQILAATASALAITYVTATLLSDLTTEQKLDRLENAMKIITGAMWLSKPKVPKIISPYDG